MNTAIPFPAREIKITEWFTEYSNRLLVFVRSKVKNLEEAEDIVQDVWFQLTKMEDISKIELAGAWLFAVAKNRLANFYKKKKNIPFSNIAQNSDENSDNFNQCAADNFSDDALNSSEFWHKLNLVLDSLPIEQKEAFIAHELYDISFKELSETTGESVNTLLARKRYAVLKLREVFGE